MGQESKKSVEIRDFPGLASDADPHDVAPGAAEVQVNVTGERPGTLRGRPGLKRVVFDEDVEA
jgi:hypothetical protein